MAAWVHPFNVLKPALSQAIRKPEKPCLGLRVERIDYYKALIFLGFFGLRCDVSVKLFQMLISL